MTSFMPLDGVTSFLRLKDVTISCKRMRRSLSIGGSSCNGGKLEEDEDFECWLVGFVALRPKSTAMVIAGRSVHLTTLFPGQA